MSSCSTLPDYTPSIFESTRLIWPTVWKTTHAKPPLLSPPNRQSSLLPTEAIRDYRSSPTPDLTTSPTTSESSLLSTFSDFVRSGYSDQHCALNSYVKQIFRQDLIANQVICAGAYFSRELEATTPSCAEGEIEYVSMRGQAGLLRQSDGVTPQEIEYADASVYGYGYHPEMHFVQGTVKPVDACAGVSFHYDQDYAPLPTYHEGYQVQDVFTQADIVPRIVDYDQSDDYCQYNSLDSGMASLPQRPAKPMLELNPNAAAFVPAIAIQPPSPSIRVEVLSIDTNADAALPSLNSSGPPRLFEEMKKPLVGFTTKKAKKRRNEIKIVMGSGWNRM